MDFAANPVTDLVAPPPSPAAQSAARDDDGPGFRDHLDAHEAPGTPAEDHARPIHTSAKQTKPAKASPSDDTQAADTTQKTDSDDAAGQAAPTGKTEKPAHAVIVQVLPQADTQEATPPLPAPSQQTVQQQPAPAASAAATSPNAPLHSQALAAQPPTTQATANANARPEKLGKTELKTRKADDDAPQAPEQTVQQQGDAKQTAPPIPQAAAAPSQAPANTPANTNGKKDDAIGAVQAKGQDTAAPSKQTRAPTAPQAAPHADAAPADATKDGAPKANAGHTEKAANTATGAKAAGAKGPDFQALADAASSGSDHTAPSSAAPSSANAAPLHASATTNAGAPDLGAMRAAAAPVAAQVAHEIIRRTNGDNTRFELRLDPPELGKIQVQLDVSRDHKVTAVVSADSPQALSDLSRGARDLQQALQSAGLDLADDGLSFNLSNPQNGFSQPDQSNSNNNANPGAAQHGLGAENQSSADTSTARARPLSIESWRGSRIDMMA